MTDESTLLINGTATFVDDVRDPLLNGVAHAVFVRSTMAHARLSVDLADVRGVPGVRRASQQRPESLMGADMVLYAVRDIDRGQGVDDVRVLEALNERIEDLEDLEITALVDQNWFDSLDNAEDLATVIAGDSSTYRDAAFAEIQVAIQHAAATIFLSGSRELARFTDSAGRTWLMTGGPSWGDPPTEHCDAVRMLDHIGISNRRVEHEPKLTDDEFSDEHLGEAISVLEEIAEGLRGEWTQGHLEVIADLESSAGFDTSSSNRYTHHNEDRGATGTVPGTDWGCR